MLPGSLERLGTVRVVVQTKFELCARTVATPLRGIIFPASTLIPWVWSLAFCSAISSRFPTAVLQILLPSTMDREACRLSCNCIALARLSFAVSVQAQSQMTAQRSCGFARDARLVESEAGSVDLGGARLEPRVAKFRSARRGMAASAEDNDAPPHPRLTYRRSRLLAVGHGR
jgi:hypothetical protein